VPPGAGAAYGALAAASIVFDTSVPTAAESEQSKEQCGSVLILRQQQSMRICPQSVPLKMMRRTPGKMARHHDSGSNSCQKCTIQEQPSFQNPKFQHNAEHET
jgi:hypothetical protein